MKTVTATQFRAALGLTAARFNDLRWSNRLEFPIPVDYRNGEPLFHEEHAQLYADLRRLRQVMSPLQQGYQSLIQARVCLAQEKAACKALAVFFESLAVCPTTENLIARAQRYNFKLPSFAANFKKALKVAQSEFVSFSAYASVNPDDEAINGIAAKLGLLLTELKARPDFTKTYQLDIEAWQIPTSPDELQEFQDDCADRAAHEREQAQDCRDQLTENESDALMMRDWHQDYKAMVGQKRNRLMKLSREFIMDSAAGASA